MYFGISGKQTMDSMSLYNDVGLISKQGSEDIASESAENS